MWADGRTIRWSNLYRSRFQHVTRSYVPGPWLTGASLIRISTNMHRMSLSMTDCEPIQPTVPAYIAISKTITMAICRYVQIIKVIDEIKPRSLHVENQTVCIDKDCVLPQSIYHWKPQTIAAMMVEIRVDITRPDRQSRSTTGYHRDYGNNGLAGIYKVQESQRDKCGNEDTCNFTITIRDCKKPTHIVSME